MTGHIFISHSTADKALAEKFVDFLKEAIGVPNDAIFCSSVNGHGIPLGTDFNEYMKSKIQNPELVILLMTPSYMESAFCLMELGATWAQSLRRVPIVVPPTNFDAVTKTLGLSQAWKIDDHAKLIDLREVIKQIPIVLEPRTEHVWESKRTVWKADLKNQLKKLAPATKVSAADHHQLESEKAGLMAELATMEEAYNKSQEVVEELKAAKDPDAVKEIMSARDGFDAEAKFEELLKAIREIKPPISMWLYREIIMTFFGIELSVDMPTTDQKEDIKRAVSYKLLDPDFPHGVLMASTKVQKLRSAVKELERLLETPEAQDLVRKREKLGEVMEVNDLQFWEEHLW